MDFRILGPLELEGDDGPIQVRGRKEQALLVPSGDSQTTEGAGSGWPPL